MKEKTSIFYLLLLKLIAFTWLARRKSENKFIFKYSAVGLHFRRTLFQSGFMVL